MQHGQHRGPVRGLAPRGKQEVDSRPRLRSSPQGRGSTARSRQRSKQQDPRTSRCRGNSAPLKPSCANAHHRRLQLAPHQRLPLVCPTVANSPASEFATRPATAAAARPRQRLRLARRLQLRLPRHQQLQPALHQRLHSPGISSCNSPGISGGNSPGISGCNSPGRQPACLVGLWQATPPNMTFRRLSSG